jgi:hypothetical protein
VLLLLLLVLVLVLVLVATGVAEEEEKELSSCDCFLLTPTPFHCIALHLYHMIIMFSSVASTSPAALAAAPDFVLSSFLLLLL